MTDFLDTLVQVIEDRKQNPKPGSYTNTLLDDPVKAAQKVGEEATEVVIAALVQNDGRLLEEIADLVYHTIVLLTTRDLTWKDVVKQLENRHRPELRLKYDQPARQNQSPQEGAGSKTK
jgi:phosphoribosyl-ATP pyrophosphohydrolase